jgi:ABC-type glycerol-3-phosphate transport system substrate-binding protein
MLIDLFFKEETMKSIISILLALLIVVSFAGCGAPSATPSEKPAETTSQAPAAQPSEKPAETPAEAGPGDLKAELTLWSMPLTNDMETMLTNELIAGFNKQYPNVKINLEMLTWEGGPEKLQIALGTGTTPDLYIDGTARTAALPSKNVLVDISDVIAKYQDKYFPSLLNIGKLDGKNYILPIMSMNAIAMAVNVDLAKELGTFDLLPADKKSWTFTDFYNFCKATTEAGKSKGVYAAALYAGSQSSDIAYYSMMLSGGGKILSDDHKTSAANSPENVAVIEMLGKLAKENLISPGASTLKDEDTDALFYNSKIVIDVSGSPIYMATTLKQMQEEGSVKTRFEIAPYMYPSADGKTYHTASWGANTMVLFKNKEDSAKIQAGKAFMDYYLSSPDFQAKLCAGAGNTPIFQGVQVPLDDPGIKAINDQIAEWTGLYADSSFGILEPNWIQCRSKFYPEMQALYSGKKTAQEVLDSYKAGVDAVLAGK